MLSTTNVTVEDVVLTFINYTSTMPPSDRDSCYRELGNFRMTAITIGAFMSLVGLAFNLFIFAVLISNRRVVQSSFMFLLSLSVCDIIICLSYIPLVAVDRFRWFPIMKKTSFILAAWSQYFVPLMTTVHVFKPLSGYLILSATIDRYLITRRTRNRHQKSNLQAVRSVLLVFSVLIPVVMKAPTFFEVSMVDYNSTCYPFEMPRFSGFFKDNWTYHVVYKFWIRNIVTVFVPFLLMALFNTLVVLRLGKIKRRALMFRSATASGHKAEMRAATHMLVIMVCLNLLSNSLNVFLTAWEFIDIQSLNQFPALRYNAAELITVLSVMGSCSRFPIYWVYRGRAFREQSRHLLAYCLCRPVDHKWKMQHHSSKPYMMKYDGLIPTSTGNDAMLLPLSNQIDTLTVKLGYGSSQASSARSSLVPSTDGVNYTNGYLKRHSLQPSTDAHKMYSGRSSLVCTPDCSKCNGNALMYTCECNKCDALYTADGTTCNGRRSLDVMSLDKPTVQGYLVSSLLTPVTDMLVEHDHLFDSTEEIHL